MPKTMEGHIPVGPAEKPERPEMTPELKAGIEGIYACGFHKGKDYGYEMGFTNGKSTLSTTWFFWVLLLTGCVCFCLGLGIEWLMFLGEAR